MCRSLKERHTKTANTVRAGKRTAGARAQAQADQPVPLVSDTDSFILTSSFLHRTVQTRDQTFHMQCFHETAGNPKQAGGLQRVLDSGRASVAKRPELSDSFSRVDLSDPMDNVTDAIS